MEEPGLPKEVAWKADALGRKPLADYLTESLNNQSASRNELLERGLTVALDADWGAGKTFFVREWIKDLRSLRHPVVYFDAWENDIGDEASIALMSAILGEVNCWKSKLPKDQEVLVHAQELREKSVRKLRRAIVPVASVIAKGLLKKATAIAVDELVDAVSSVDNDSVHSSTDLDDALDKVFEEALKEHASRREALSLFRSSLSDLLDMLVSKAGAKAPLYVFIDELDRCRPTYAVRLLEEIKHIFGVRNVVYVVSTNIDQLQCSVKAIYGADFDGRRYLRRLFDREYTLPKPDNRKYAGKIFGDESFARSRKIELGLPKGLRQKLELASVWSLISDSFLLDFRTQKQVLAHVEEAVSAIDEGLPVHVLWLFYLCALFHSDPGLLRDLADARLDAPAIRKVILDSLRSDPEIEYMDGRRNHYSRRDEFRKVKLSAVLSKYGELAVMNARDLVIAETVNAFDYPDNLLALVQREFGGGYGQHEPEFASIYRYAAIVRGSGFLMPIQEESVAA